MDLSVCFQSILGSMRFVLMMASLLIISVLIFKEYSNGLGSKNDAHVGGQQDDPLKKAGEVNQLIQDAANTQRQELEKQIQ
jgi:hypothetical protein